MGTCHLELWLGFHVPRKFWHTMRRFSWTCSYCLMRRLQSWLPEPLYKILFCSNNILPGLGGLAHFDHFPFGLQHGAALENHLKITTDPECSNVNPQIYTHIIPLLNELHQLQGEFKVQVITFKSLTWHGTEFPARSLSPWAIYPFHRGHLPSCGSLEMCLFYCNPHPMEYPSSEM